MPPTQSWADCDKPSKSWQDYASWEYPWLPLEKLDNMARGGGQWGAVGSDSLCDSNLSKHEKWNKQIWMVLFCGSDVKKKTEHYLSLLCNTFSANGESLKLFLLSTRLLRELPEPRSSPLHSAWWIASHVFELKKDLCFRQLKELDGSSRRRARWR